MPPLNDSESALSKIEDLSLNKLSETIARLEGLTDNDAEKKDRADNYFLRKQLKQILAEALGCLPFVIKVFFFVVTLCISALLLKGTYHLFIDDKKLFEFIWYVIWSSLIYMAAHFRDTILKRK